MRIRTRGSTALLIAMFTVAAAVACTTPSAGIGTGAAPVADDGGGEVSASATGIHRQLTYGPFSIPAARGATMGMLPNTFRLGVAKPCTNCYVTYIRAGLIDATTGRSLNVNTGQWLHHMVLINSGATDLVCAVKGGQWFFASGNERTPVDLSKMGNYGYPVRLTDSWSMIVDLMNMATTASRVRITLDFNYVPMGTAGMRPARPLWIDAGGCPGASEVPTLGRKVFTLNAGWTVTRPGKLLYFHGHMHDGATNMDITAGGREVCNSVQHYGESPEYVEGGMDHSMPGMDMGMAHISSVVQCYGGSAGLANLAMGQRVNIAGHYDNGQHPLMKNGGRDENVMAIAHGWIDVGS